ncbi:hypothetical protein [Isoptericola croceus]|uniref:hypothetical protein n=1 Tax=Isoptericola croceus TaxID=3031406 RepID=UPI0023F86FC4|nr:hypothetical protein [Isoptericola croceus]
MSTHDENLHPRAGDGKFATKAVSESAGGLDALGGEPDQPASEPIPVHVAADANMRYAEELPPWPTAAGAEPRAAIEYNDADDITATVWTDRSVVRVAGFTGYESGADTYWTDAGAYDDDPDTREAVEAWAEAFHSRAQMAVHAVESAAMHHAHAEIVARAGQIGYDAEGRPQPDSALDAAVSAAGGFGDGVHVSRRGQDVSLSIGDEASYRVRRSDAGEVFLHRSDGSGVPRWEATAAWGEISRRMNPSAASSAARSRLTQVLADLARDQG